MGIFSDYVVNFQQIGALLKKDYLVRRRSPWITSFIFIWPCLVFLSLYILEIRNAPKEIDDCQFKPRLLPTKREILPYIQSFMCSLDNVCIDPNKYRETMDYSDALFTPALHIIQAFLNEDALLNPIIRLPKNRKIFDTILSLASTPHISGLSDLMKTFFDRVSNYDFSFLNSSFVANFWHEPNSFSTIAKMLCGSPLEFEEDPPFLDDFYHMEDFKKMDQNEYDSMPNKFCKELYVNITKTTKGKLSWYEIKPGMFGKIVYAPDNEITREIMKHANGTLEGVYRMQQLVSSLNATLVLLRTDKAFQDELINLIELAKMAFETKSFGLSIDPAIIDKAKEYILTDKSIYDIFQIATGALECFSVNRFIPVKNEKELTERAFELNKDKTFLAGVLFNMTNTTESIKEYSYKLRMTTENTQITQFNRNKFWFPGPDSETFIHLQYHFGFTQLQYEIDKGIIKTAKQIEQRKRNRIQRRSIVEAPTDMNVNDVHGAVAASKAIIGNGTNHAIELVKPIYSLLAESHMEQKMNDTNGRLNITHHESNGNHSSVGLNQTIVKMEKDNNILDNVNNNLSHNNKSVSHNETHIMPITSNNTKSLANGTDKPSNVTINGNHILEIASTQTVPIVNSADLDSTNKTITDIKVNLNQMNFNHTVKNTDKKELLIPSFNAINATNTTNGINATNAVHATNAINATNGNNGTNKNESVVNRLTEKNPVSDINIIENKTENKNISLFTIPLNISVNLSNLLKKSNKSDKLNGLPDNNNNNNNNNNNRTERLFGIPLNITNIMKNFGHHPFLVKNFGGVDNIVKNINQTVNVNTNSIKTDKNLDTLNNHKTAERKDPDHKVENETISIAHTEHVKNHPVTTIKPEILNNTDKTDNTSQNKTTDHHSIDEPILTTTTTTTTTSIESHSDQNKKFQSTTNTTNDPEANNENSTNGNVDVHITLNITTNNDDKSNQNHKKKHHHIYTIPNTSKISGKTKTPVTNGIEPVQKKLVLFDINNVTVYTKQMPYPKYVRDRFKSGLLVAQSVQLAFFFGLFGLVASMTRHRLWIRESGNLVLMQVMGLRKSSEVISWMITSLIELCISFFFCSVILYCGGILISTNKFFLTMLLVQFAFGIVSFCYMVSNFFSQAGIGSITVTFIFTLGFTPFILIRLLTYNISFLLKSAISMSITTSFCYIWQEVMRYELQQKSLSFSEGFSGTIFDNDIKFGMAMNCISTCICLIIGATVERLTGSNSKFHKIQVKSMDPIVGAKMINVCKGYGKSVLAVQNATITFKRNHVTCLLGRNGAGKSTLIKLLSGQLTPNSGKVYLPVNLNHLAGYMHQDKIGLCPQNNILIPNLTAREHLELYASIKLESRQNAEIYKIMKKIDFGKYEEYPIEYLSGGYKRRLNVAIAFLGSPHLVILDEPCNGVDSTARKIIWDLISAHKEGRAVALATHYLDEAEHLSDSVFILKEGKVVCENDSDSLRAQFTQSFDLHVSLSIIDAPTTLNIIKNRFEEYLTDFYISERKNYLLVNIPYYDTKKGYINFAPLLQIVESLQMEGRIQQFNVQSKDLEGIFKKVHDESNETDSDSNSGTGPRIRGFDTTDLFRMNPLEDDVKCSRSQRIRYLFWKRLKHFTRNYKIISCIIIYPIIFQLFGLYLQTFRADDEFGPALELNRNLYANTTEFYSYNPSSNNNFISHLHCASSDCRYFKTSEEAFYWALRTEYDFIENRYGGISVVNDTYSVWYHNKGYHAVPVYLNELTTTMFQSQMNDSEYKIRITNHPLKLSRNELSASSVLQAVSDGGIACIFLLSFCYVLASSSLYVVNERISGEKLQQNLCGVSFAVYWGVAFFWDLIIYTLSLIPATIILELFNCRMLVHRDQLLGFCAISFMFGFAAIPMIHLVEKLFTDASQSSMVLLVANGSIATATITMITFIDVLTHTMKGAQIRDFFNTLFLIFPQHGFADGMVNLFKNFLTADLFEKFEIDTYKSPVFSNLLLNHYVSLTLLAIVYIIINYCIEKHRSQNYITNGETTDVRCELEFISTIGNGIAIKDNDKYDYCPPTDVLRVTNLSKCYGTNKYALKDVSFQIRKGECFGLLGINGAGKSTIFSILSGQIRQTSGTINFLGKRGVSYCPQSNALDNLLTVNEVIRFFGVLRKVSNLKQVTEKILQTYHLEKYKNVLVKNLSGGNRRKLSVAVTCMGSCNLVLMDEPTSDMDPVTRSLVYKSINDVINEKRSVILTSHTISEIERVCQRIGILKDGKIVMVGTPNALKVMFGNSYLVTIFFDNNKWMAIERDVKRDIPDHEHLIVHSHCLQFTVKIKSQRKTMSIYQVEEGNIYLSELFDKLHKIALTRNIEYTVSECLLNQAIERILDTNFNSAYSNLGFIDTESVT